MPQVAGEANAQEVAAGWHAGRASGIIRCMDRQARAELMKRLRRDAARIAERFDLRYQSIQPESARVKRRYGSCDGDGRIWIRLNHVRTKKSLKYSSLVDTLCHELAHLRYFHHGPAFKAFYFYLLDWAREQGIYRPTPRGATSVKASSTGLRGASVNPQNPENAPALASRGESPPGREQQILFGALDPGAVRSTRPRRRKRPLLKPHAPASEQLQLL
ncbi:MAG: DUF45 domain-containing protein [Candidatus Eisenbacteria bacterium]|nr:DUF45 domain-containing protein [Candidatus Eisenbacteria bacterium]